MKLGLVTGQFLNEWTAQSFLKLKTHNIDITAICSEDNWYDTSHIRMPIRRLKRFGQYNRIPLISQGIQFFLPYNNHLLNFGAAVRDQDILHSFEAWSPFSRQCLATGKPTVITVYENIPFNNERALYARWKRDIYENAEHILAVTEKAKDAMIREGADASRISVIPMGIDTERFMPAEKDAELMRANRLSKDAITIFFMGALIWRKGILHLMDAFRALHKEHPKLRLLIAGTGPLKQEIIKRAQKWGIAHAITLLDSVPYHETHRIHNLADIFVLPSIPDKTWEEQFGFVLVEAMACGKPVVSTFSGSIPEVVRDQETGLLVQPGSVPELAKALQQLIKDEGLRHRLGREGRKHVLMNYKDSMIAEKLSKVYAAVIRF